MLKKALLLFVLAVMVFPLLAAGGAKAPAPGPADAVKAFYTFHFAHDMGFTEKNLTARKGWLSPELFGLLAAELKKPTSPNEVPLIEGDPFTDSEEYPKSFKVGDASIQTDKASVPVTLIWPDEKTSVTVKLVLASGEWRIDDVVYGPEDSLRKLLNPKP